MRKDGALLKGAYCFAISNTFALLSDKYVALDVNPIYRKKEDLNRVWILCKVPNPLSPVETMELLLDKLGKTRSDAEFLDAMSGLTGLRS
jgi:hypothetical protein